MAGKSNDRIQYFRGLRLIVDAGKEKQNETETPLPDSTSLKFRKYFNDMIWLEIKAKHCGHSLMEHDQWLMHKRQVTVSRLCNKISRFKFNPVSLSLVKENTTVKECGCFLQDSTIKLSGDYLKNLFAGLKQVMDLQDEIQNVENLYSSNSGIINDHPEFGDKSLQDVTGTLSCWLNSSSELMWTLMSMVNLVGSEKHKDGISGFLYDLNLIDTGDLVEDFFPASFPKVSDLSFSCCKLSESILEMTEMQFHKRSVRNIHMQLLKNYFGSLCRSRTVICLDNRKTLQQERQAEENEEWNALFSSLCNMDFLTMYQNSPKTNQVFQRLLEKGDSDLPPSAVDFFDLPELEPLHVFLCNIMFSIMGQCLKARLQQALSCQDKCSSSTSLLTVQQVVTECKEVIECSVITLSVHMFLMHSPDCKSALDSFEKSSIDPFRQDLMQLFCTYMDFVKLLVIGQLNGLPNAPHFFINILNEEWNFAKKISQKIGLGDVCTKKYIEMCTEVFVSAQNFLESAVNAILTSKTKIVNLSQMKITSPVPVQETPHYSRCKSTDNSQTPTSPQAGVLWFHRQRSESPHLARKHSFLNDSGIAVDDFLMLQSPFFDGSDWDPTESTRRYLFELGRALRDMFQEVRERFMRAGHYANVLKKDLEHSIAFRYIKDFSCKKRGKVKACAGCDFLKRLSTYGCIQINLHENLCQHKKFSWLLSVFDPLKYNLFICVNPDADIRPDRFEHAVLHALFSCCTNDSFCLNLDTNIPEVVLVVRRWDNLTTLGEQVPKAPRKRTPLHICKWDGQSLPITYSNAQNFRFDCLTPIDQQVIFEHDVTVVCANGSLLPQRRKQFLKLISKFAKIEVCQMNILTELKHFFLEMQRSIVSFCQALITQIYNMSKHLHKQVESELHTFGSEVEALVSEINQITQRIFNTGFECLHATSSLLVGPIHVTMDELQTSFVQKWMQYILKHLPRGTGKKPRWAAKGLKFLVSLNMDYVNNLDESEYLKFKELVNRFFDHLIGSKTKSDTPVGDLSPCIGKKVVYRSLSGHSSSGSPPADYFDEETNLISCGMCSNEFVDGIRSAISALEEDLDRERFDNSVVGRILESDEYAPVVQHQVRSASFRWQRGKKIGEGTFGRVYTCVNIDTGKILAMKEIQFQAHDEGKVKEILDEMTNFEGIVHPNLVRYFGVEIHRDLMFIFMEYCDSGTLADISQVGLPEVMIQQYCSQLVTAVHVLHQQGIVHRDIKGSNVFLMSTGQIKLGDFGSAIRLRDRNKTSPGEILSRTGITTAYTAPEVINNSTGYGRAADIWSIGCVVIEMATGKRPWHDHEPFQIMYKVGMGTKPPVPCNLSEDGQAFIEHCLVVDTSVRWSTTVLLSHPFVKVAHPVQE